MSEITGYRNLSAEEIALINEVKAHAEVTRVLMEKIENRLLEHPLSDPLSDPHTMYTNPLRWFHIGATELQQGYMSVIRAIARPTTF